MEGTVGQDTTQTMDPIITIIKAIFPCFYDRLPNSIIIQDLDVPGYGGDSLSYQELPPGSHSMLVISENVKISA